MNISRKRKGKQEIPNASTSDIAFLLIIFFMATTKFDVKEGLTLVLPPAAQEGATVVKLTQKNMTKIMIANTGEISFNGTSVGIYNQTVLDSNIKGLLAKNPQMIFSIKTDRDAKYDEMIKVLDRLKAAGADKISLSTN